MPVTLGEEKDDDIITAYDIKSNFLIVKLKFLNSLIHLNQLH
jgi:hypothetical protein